MTTANTRWGSTPRCASPTTTSSPSARRKRKSAASCAASASPNYIEGAGGAPRERAEITVSPQGRVELVLGTMNSGQGHETSFAQLICEWLGVPFETIDFVAHDTDRVSAGGGSHSGRSMRIASLAIGEAHRRHHREGQEDRRAYLRGEPRRHSNSRGRVRRRRAPTAASASSRSRKQRRRATICPTNCKGKLDGIGDHTVSVGAYPSGTHICEVEVDPDTGYVQLVGWYGVDDVGLAVNPMILHGQTHGAAAQGIGQAMLEDVALRPRQRPDARRLVHGLRHAARRLPALVHLRADRGAGDEPQIRHPSRRRRRHDAGARRLHQRGRATRCPISASAMSRCRQRPSACGARSKKQERSKPSPSR